MQKRKRSSVTRLVESRESVILPLCRNKEVLDIGCVGRAASYGHPEWLHGKICKVAASCLGIDIQHEKVKKLQEFGYKVVYGNAETVNLNKKFDVVVASEVIEHLNNQGLFLQNMRKHLKDDGIMIITTPNCFSASRRIGFYLLPQHGKYDPDHTLVHNEGTLRVIARRCGWIVKDLYYSSGFPCSLKGKIFRNVISVLPIELQGFTIIVILKKKR